MDMAKVDNVRKPTIRFGTKPFQEKLNGCLDSGLHESVRMLKNNSYIVVGGTSVDETSETNLNRLADDLTPNYGKRSTTGTSSFMNCVGIGLPFLTINLRASKMFLKKHKLSLKCVYTMCSSREILEDALLVYGHQLKDQPVTAGGTTLNIAWMAQYMQQQSKTVVFLGARAMDDDALTIVELCRMMRLGIRMEEVDKGITSVLLVLHVNKWWCEVYFTDQLISVSTSFIDRSSITKLLERTSIIYATELGILLMPKVIQMVAYFCFSRFKHFVTIIHNSACLANGSEAIIIILKYTDILFLTPESAEMMINIFNIPRAHRCCFKFRLAWDIFIWVKSISQKTCTIVVSDGRKKAYVHTDLCTGMSSKYKSPYWKSSAVVDHYGTPRAFVGGFMAMMIAGFQVDSCVECGFFCASLVAGRFGMSLPETREEVVHKWFGILHGLLGSKSTEIDLDKRESSLPFTVFQSPWKENEANAEFASRSRSYVTPINEFENSYSIRK